MYTLRPATTDGREFTVAVLELSRVARLELQSRSDPCRADAHTSRGGCPRVRDCVRKEPAKTITEILPGEGTRSIATILGLNDFSKRGVRDPRYTGTSMYEENDCG